MDDTLAQLVGALGFPIVVAFYVLVRVEKGIKELTTMVHELALAIAKLGEPHHHSEENDGVFRR